ncbi:MAG: cysteine desulfurase [Oscillospiraceae bacterium]|nr:cysteine desulfurase [Oscillospiraceae bacterium]
MNAYLDNAATTRVWPEAAQAALRAMTEDYFNPSSRYPSGTLAAKALEENRRKVAQALGCQAKELVFTSCGTESDNWAILSAVQKNARRGTHIITTAVEHHAVLEPIRTLERSGYTVTRLPVDRQGQINLDDLQNALREDTVLVSMMLVNNELGTVLPVREAAQIVKRSGTPALFHCDAVQGFLKLPFTPRELGVDLLSISGHKVHAPKGIGALYIRSGLKLPPLLTGGGQEGGLRSGTEPTAQIAAFAAACEAGLARRDEDIAHMRTLRDYTLARLAEEVPQVSPIVPGDAPHILALTMTGYKSEVLVRVLGDRGVCVSAGSACHRGKPSHVYAALGLSRPERDGAFRVSFSGDSTRAEVDALIEGLKYAAATLFPSMS